MAGKALERGVVHCGIIVSFLHFMKGCLIGISSSTQSHGCASLFTLFRMGFRTPLKLLKERKNTAVIARVCILYRQMQTIFCSFCCCNKWPLACFSALVAFFCFRHWKIAFICRLNTWQLNTWQFKKLCGRQLFPCRMKAACRSISDYFTFCFSVKQVSLQGEQRSHHMPFMFMVAGEVCAEVCGWSKHTEAERREERKQLKY